jgi:hypothetical protein
MLHPPGLDVAETRLSRVLARIRAGRFTKNYALPCFDPAEIRTIRPRR